VRKTDRDTPPRPISIRRKLPPLTLGLLGLLLGMADPAFAQRRGEPTEQTPGRADKDGKPRAVSGPIFAVISIGDQRMSVYGGEGLVARTPVSTGMRGHPTPTGVFSIVQKKRWHRSNIYSGAPMPFMQRITWSGIALHAGPLPGYPASHGCIRLPSGFAQRLFGMTEIGYRVIISPRDVTPATVSHKNLPVPYIWPAEDALEARADQSGETTSAIAGGKLEQVSLTAAPAATTGLNPLDYARDMKRRATEKARLAASATKASQVLTVKKAAELRVASRKLAIAGEAVEDADEAFAAAAKKLAKVEDENFGNVAAAHAAMAAALAEAKNQEEQARALKQAKEQELAAARLAAQEARASGKAAAAAIVEANRRLRPVSIFISRKTGKLYVRQDWKPLFDAPISIREPERPIGTHVFIGTHAAENGTDLIWTAVSMPPEGEQKSSGDGPRRGRVASSQAPAAVPAPAPSLPAETALGAIDRVTIPEDTARRLAELSWVGASLTISDHGISGETGETTDFIILTRSRASAP
jgi:hypothetical protein